MNALEEFGIEINWDGMPMNFTVKDYVHHDERCKFEVFQDNKLVASFEPDRDGYLHVCKDNQKLPEELIYLLADTLETQPWH